MGLNQNKKGIKVLRNKNSAAKKNKGRVLNPNVSRVSMLKLRGQKMAQLQKRRDKKENDVNEKKKSAKQKLQKTKEAEEDDDLDIGMQAEGYFVPEEKVQLEFNTFLPVPN